jgi:hypothetical protein
MKRPSDQSFPQSWVPALATLLTTVLYSACHSGGGGGDSLPPTVVGASFGGAGATPVAGDTLLLSFSEDVTAAAGTGVDDNALLLSAGATLGAATTVQDQPTTRSVRLLLGAGVSFTPGSTTVQFAPTNVVVADLAGNKGRDGDAIVIDATDGAAPAISNLTLDGIDGILNGTGPAGGVLQVPQNAFVVDLAYGDTGSPGAALGVDPARTQVTASVAVTASGLGKPAGTNLLPFLTVVGASTATASYSVPTTTVFPTGPVTLTAVVVDAGGLASPPATFAFTVHAWTTLLQPFETTVNAQQVWFLDTSRDIESFSTSAIVQGASVDITATPNGRSDYLDILFVLGLQSATPIANVIGTDDSNTVVQSRLQTEILANLTALYSNSNVTFTFSQPAGSFGGNSSLDYNSFGYSQICVAGSDDSAPLAILGIAQLDPSNQRQNNDCLLESATTARLGVFLHTIAQTGLAPPSNSTFRLDFNSLVPALGGTAIGDAASDDLRLQGALTDTRSGHIDNAIAGLSRFIAVIAAHECGHSVGMVINGPMPTGLYGGDPANFPGSSDGHIRTQALFPNGTNVMSPQLSYSLAIDAATAFNSLNLAYLREQAFYGN